MGGGGGASDKGLFFTTKKKKFKKEKMVEMAADALFYAQRLNQINAESKKLDDMDSEKIALRIEELLPARQEIISDLFIRLEYYESQDNKPPSGTGASSDRGIVLSLEWTK